MSRKALIVGMEHYDHCTPLVGCINDANNIAQLLSKNEDCSDNFICEIAHDLSTRELTYKIRDLFSQDLDIGLFYFSGHGSTMFGDEYICTKDSDKIIPYNGQAFLDRKILLKSVFCHSMSIYVRHHAVAPVFQNVEFSL